MVGRQGAPAREKTSRLHRKKRENQTRLQTSEGDFLKVEIKSKG